MCTQKKSLTGNSPTHARKTPTRMRHSRTHRMPWACEVGDSSGGVAREGRDDESRDDEGQVERHRRHIVGHPERGQVVFPPVGVARGEHRCQHPLRKEHGQDDREQRQVHVRRRVEHDVGGHRRRRTRERQQRQGEDLGADEGVLEDDSEQGPRKQRDDPVGEGERGDVEIVQDRRSRSSLTAVHDVAPRGEGEDSGTSRGNGRELAKRARARDRGALEAEDGERNEHDDNEGDRPDAQAQGLERSLLGGSRTLGSDESVSAAGVGGSRCGLGHGMRVAQRRQRISRRPRWCRRPVAGHDGGATARSP